MMTITAISQKSSTYIIGTYTPADELNNADTKSAYIAHFDELNGTLTITDSLAAGYNASFITADRAKKVLYAVNELNGAEPRGEVKAFGYTLPWTSANYLGGCSTKGNDPCHVSISRKKGLVTVANYSSGNIISIPTSKAGKLMCASATTHQHKGSGPHPNQAEPHAHQAVAAPFGNFIYSCDLGTDEILIYTIKGNPATLTHTKTVKTAAGAGPRHLTFHPSAKYAYVINELNGTIECFAVNKKDGNLTNIQTVKTSEESKTDGADIHITSDGRFLYATNRADVNEIVCYEIDAQNGKLQHKHTYPTGGRGPRNFIITDGDKYILIAHQYTNNIVIFKRNRTDGSLENTGKSVNVHSPVCITKL